MSWACGWKSFSHNPRRHSVIHRRDTPRSIRGQRNPKGRHGCSRLVRSWRNPEHREPLLNQYRWVFESKLHKHGVEVCFASSARRRGRRRERNYCYFTNKPLFTRSSRVLRRSDSSKGRQLGVPCRTSSLIGAGHIDIIIFLEKRMFACRVYCFSCFSLVFCLLPIAYFSRLVDKLPRQVRKAM